FRRESSRCRCHSSSGWHSSAPPSGRSPSSGLGTASVRATRASSTTSATSNTRSWQGSWSCLGISSTAGRPQLELARVQTIPLVDVRAEYEPLIPRLEAAFREVLDGKGFIRGANYWAFQEEAAAYLGVQRTIGVANGTDALVLALDALGVGPGD